MFLVIKKGAEFIGYHLTKIDDATIGTRKIIHCVWARTDFSKDNENV